MRKNTDILCAGELLAELITAEFVQNIEEANLFKRVPGGSPANLSMNMARLGKSALLIAAVGQDDMGTVLKNYVARMGVDVSGVTQIEDQPTSLIVTTRSAFAKEFTPYRGADSLLSIRQFNFQRLEETSLFHTSCFAFSRKPARQVILDAAERAKRAGCQLSIDVNFSEKIWPDRLEAQRTLMEYARQGAMIKISDADWVQLYGDMPASPEVVLDHFLKNGVKEVCYTLGREGLWVANDQERHFLESRLIEGKEMVGTGDAFWAGYLTAWLDDYSLLQRALAGRRMAEIRISQTGSLPDLIDKNVLYENFDAA